MKHEAMREYFLSNTTNFMENIHNIPPIFIVLIVGCIIQLTKVTIDSISAKHFSLENIFSSGGFPSFHSGVASSITVIALMHDGIRSITFAIAFIFSLLFAYDAMNHRFETGEHAKYINALSRKTSEENTNTKKKLKERIGHTPGEVLGGIIFGTILTFILYYIFYV